jgi:hypothetical protein
MGDVPDATITAQLALAANSVDVKAFGARADEATMLLASHLIAISPGGRMARLESKDGVTTYWTRFEQIQSEAGALLSRVP